MCNKMFLVFLVEAECPVPGSHHGHIQSCHWGTWREFPPQGSFSCKLGKKSLPTSGEFPALRAMGVLLCPEMNSVEVLFMSRVVLGVSDGLLRDLLKGVFYGRFLAQPHLLQNTEADFRSCLVPRGLL